VDDSGKDANDIHSIFAWQAGSKAYAVIVDASRVPMSTSSTSPTRRSR
jgi:hypothetical protein